MDGLEIDYLEHHPAAVDVIAGWVWTAWGYPSPGACAADLRRSRAGSPPSAFMAVRRGEPVGIVNLIPCNLPPRCDLTPWLAGLYVHPRHRRRGFGSALVRFCEREARRLEHPFLYLYTRHAEAFYERLGWLTIDTVMWEADTVVVMRRSPAEPLDAAPRQRGYRCPTAVTPRRFGPAPGRDSGYEPWRVAAIRVALENRVPH
jgi:GNAT superfamily N-acetyltransferase